MSRTLKITPTESVTVRVSTPELLEVEATYALAGKEPPKHYHPSQDEHFEVVCSSSPALARRLPSSAALAPLGRMRGYGRPLGAGSGSFPMDAAARKGQG